MASVKSILSLLALADSATGMELVVRWSRFSKLKPPIRRQTTLSHVSSLILLAIHVREKLRAQLKIDWELFLDAVTVHDTGEGELARDICLPFKSDEHDLKEYLAFKKLVGKLGKKTAQKLQRAFLLQFTLKNSSIFPAEARQIMAELAQNHRREALLFTCLEHFDYILYALEQYLRQGHGEMAIDVISTSLPVLDELTKELPSFQKFWSADFRQYCLDITKKG